MQFSDRQSTYPNRYKMIAADGRVTYVTLERADEPTVLGTPLNANTFNGWAEEIDANIKMSGSKTVKLWENEDTTRGFAAQTVALDLAEYDGVAIFYRSESSNANPVFFNTGHIPKGFRGCMHWLTTSGNRAHRMFTANDDGVEFEKGQYSANDTSNLWCVPAIIYGIKGVTDYGL